MNLKEIHIHKKEVSAAPISEHTKAHVMAIQILKNGLLKEHITKTPAILVCIIGEVEYEDEKGSKILLNPGDFHKIEPMVKHWVKGIVKSQLILIK